MNFIDEKLIFSLLNTKENSDYNTIKSIIDKSRNEEILNLEEVSTLLNASSKDSLDLIYKRAGEIKDEVYGKRVVTFAPLYISNYCVNNCTYCGYKRDNKIDRLKLKQEEIANEAKVLEKMGHKRVALECGEDPVNLPIDYIIDSINTIYKESSIRRINVNVAATTFENYKLLHDAEIGTYILFQETYHKETYEKVHPKSLKGDYEYHLNSFHRAMDVGIDDVGAGILFGLYDYRFEILSLLMHNLELEEKYGVGFHTVSVPRLKRAEGNNLDEYEFLIDDETFKKCVAIIRIAMPFVGIILSTRETLEIRKDLLNHGVSQISAASNTNVGGYKLEVENENEKISMKSQFELSDERSVIEVMTSLVNDGYIPSFCTACYRSGRTGDRFMELAKSKQIGNVCEPNALMTLMEYICDYGDEFLKTKGKEYVYKEANKIKHNKVRPLLLNNLRLIENGKRDLFL